MSSKTIAVVYHSVTGTTKALAERIVEGVSSVEGVKALPFEINHSDIVEGRYLLSNLNVLNEVEGIVFGSPTFKGCVSAQFKAFADARSEQWSEGRWINKLAAGFTVGSCASGEQAFTMQYLQTLAAQHGMLWVGIEAHPVKQQAIIENLNPLGASSGVIAVMRDECIHKSYLDTAFYMGKRIASLV